MIRKCHVGVLYFLAIARLPWYNDENLWIGARYNGEK